MAEPSESAISCLPHVHSPVAQWLRLAPAATAQDVASTIWSTGSYIIPDQVDRPNGPIHARAGSAVLLAPRASHPGRSGRRPEGDGMAVRGLNHIGVPVRDLDATVAWYREMLDIE